MGSAWFIWTSLSPGNLKDTVSNEWVQTEELRAPSPAELLTTLPEHGGDLESQGAFACVADGNAHSGAYLGPEQSGGGRNKLADVTVSGHDRDELDSFNQKVYTVLLEGERRQDGCSGEHMTLSLIQASSRTGLNYGENRPVAAKLGEGGLEVWD